VFSESSHYAVQKISRAPTETGWLDDSWLACGVGAGPRAAPCIERVVTTLSTCPQHSTRQFGSDSHQNSQTLGRLDRVCVTTALRSSLRCLAHGRRFALNVALERFFTKPHLIVALRKATPIQARGPVVATLNDYEDWRRTGALIQPLCSCEREVTTGRLDDEVAGRAFDWIGRGDLRGRAGTLAPRRGPSCG